MNNRSGVMAAAALAILGCWPAAARATEFKQGNLVARPQLEATSTDGNARAHFDGADPNAQPQAGDESVNAGGQAAKPSPAGEVYLKPGGQPSSQITDPPKPPKSPKVDTNPSGPHDWNGAIGGGMCGIGGGILIGFMMGGLPGALIGGLVGGLLGGAAGYFFA